MKSFSYYKIVIVLTSLIMFGCHNYKADEIITCEDPEPLGLQPYIPIPEIKIQTNRFAEYDSLFLTYNIQVKATPFSDSTHSKIFVRRLKDTDGNMDSKTNKLTLEGCHWGDSRDFRVILLSFNDGISSTLNHNDSLLIRKLESQLLDSIESKIYYFDEKDWQKFRKGYLHPYYCAHIIGEVNVIVIGSNCSNG